MENDNKNTDGKKLRFDTDWEKIEKYANKLRPVVSSLISHNLSDDEAAEKMVFLLASLANLEDGDRSEAAYLALELQQQAFTFSPKYIRAFYQHNEKILEQLADDTETEPLDLSDCSISDLSAKLSDLIANPQTPAPLQEKFRTALIEFQNEDIDQTEISDFMNSPEYIEKLLRGYKSEVSE